MRDSERTGYLLCKCNVPSEYNRQTTCSRSNSTLFSLTSHIYNLLHPSYNYIVPDTACNMKHTPLYMVNFLIYTCTHYTFYTFYPEIYYIPLNHGSCSWFYRFRLFMFLLLQNPAFHVPAFTDSGFSCSWFYRFRLFMFLVFSFLVPFHDSPFLVFQIPRKLSSKRQKLFPLASRSTQQRKKNRLP